MNGEGLSASKMHEVFIFVFRDLARELQVRYAAPFALACPVPCQFLTAVL